MRRACVAGIVMLMTELMGVEDQVGSAHTPEGWGSRRRRSLAAVAAAEAAGVAEVENVVVMRTSHSLPPPRVRVGGGLWGRACVLMLHAVVCVSLRSALIHCSCVTLFIINSLPWPCDGESGC